MVQLEIRVTGAGEASTPAEISVDGLEIHPTGTSRQFEMHNFTTSSSVTYNYTILPLKAGDVHHSAADNSRRHNFVAHA